MVKSNSVDGMQITGDMLTYCAACLKGKATQTTTPPTNKRHAHKVLGWVFADIYGPTEHLSKEGHRYLITFMDEYT
jgi:hypothetical protein